MSIFFRCPGCQKAFRVADEKAGLRTNCTRCRKLMTVPRESEINESDPNAIEAMAGATLSGEFKASDLMPGVTANGSAEAKPLTMITLECPYCFEAVEFPPDVGGKQAPCPQCRRIVKVPAPKDDRPRDWREVDSRPSLARRDDTPAPEGAWGNTAGTAGVVSRDALLEAEVIVDRKTLAAPKRKRLYLTIAGLSVVLAGLGWLIWSRQARDDYRVDLVIDAVNATDAGSATPLPAGWSSAVHAAAGQFYLNEGRPDLKSAIKHLALARAEADRAETPLDRAILLARVAIAQAGLAGDDEAVQEKRAIPWDEAKKELRQTIQNFKDLPRELAWGAIESLTRELGAKGPAKQPPLVAQVAPEAFPSEADRAEALAVVAMVLTAKGDAAGDTVAADADRAQSAAPEAKVSPRFVAKLVAQRKAAAAQQFIAAPGEGEPSLPARLAYVEGWSRTGDAADLERARKLAAAPGPVEHRAEAFALLAGACADTKDAGDALAGAVEFLAEQGAKYALPPWTLVRTARACRLAGRIDLIDKLSSVRSSPARPWVALEAIEGHADRGDPVDIAAAEDCGDKSAAQAWAWVAVARARAFATNSDVRKEIATWPNESAQRLGWIGAALGLQDRKKQ